MREGFVWLDEFFAIVDLVALGASLAAAIYWWATGQVELWRDFETGTVWAVAGVGAVTGIAIYVFEATRDKISDALSISDAFYLVGSVIALGWWMNAFVDLTERIGGPVPAPVVFFSGVMAAASFDIARRIIGPIIPLIGFLFFVYGFDTIGQALPGLLNHPGYPLERVMEFLMLSADGITGLIIDVFATYIVIFVVLGAFLEKTGLGSLIIDATYSMTGQRTGGPGLAAVFSSGLFGMISGSGVANVVTTGTFTIPLMKRVGYKPEFAGAVEAAASTGGAYMPPIMGAVPARGIDRNELFRGHQNRADTGAPLLLFRRHHRLFPGRAPGPAWRIGRRVADMGPRDPAAAFAAAHPGDDLFVGDR